MYAVIAENDESQWEDQTGVAYHFPKRYLPILQPGTQVVYYKGNLKNKIFQSSRLSDHAHYFGIAKIGSIYDDKHSSKGDKFAVIEDYRPFETPVLIRLDDDYIEQIPESRKVNYWRDGVRKIDEDTYNKIVSLAGKTKSVPKSSPNLITQNLNDSEQSFESFFEGDKKKSFVTTYERDTRLRKLALLIHGYDCKGCGFNFEKVYGEHGKEFIHVHHLKPVSEFDGKQKVDPETDLTVLCPNCHSMVHRYKNKTLTLTELQKLVNG